MYLNLVGFLVYYCFQLKCISKGGIAIILVLDSRGLNPALAKDIKAQLTVSYVR